MSERQLVSVGRTGQGENRELEGGIQPRTATQQFGIFDAVGVCGARSPFAFLNDPSAGAQAVKAKWHSLRSALTAFRAGLPIPYRKAKGASQRLLNGEFLW